MSKRKDLAQAKRMLRPQEFKEYKEWRNKPFVERYPYLANSLLRASVLLNVILIEVIIVRSV